MPGHPAPGMKESGYRTLLQQGLSSAPGIGATVTLWTQDLSSDPGPSIKKLLVSILTSHASAANGLSIEGRLVKDGTWATLAQVAIAASATVPTITLVALPAYQLRVRYTNGATVPTTWEVLIAADSMERGT